jgi:2'-5' RNA ligase
MTKERLKSPRARLFVALDLPEDVRAAIVAWQRAEATDPALRPVAPENLHVTMAFLDFQPEKRIDEIAELVRGLDTPTPRLELAREPVALPPKGRPKLFALAVESPDAVALQVDLAAKLVVARLYEPEKRPFWPHVTAARVRSEMGRSGHPRRVESPPGPGDPAIERAFYAVRITLYRSNLRAQGAEYVPLAEKEL